MDELPMINLSVWRPAVPVIVMAVVACVTVPGTLVWVTSAAAQVGYGEPARTDSLARRAPVRPASGGITPGTVETGLTGEFSSIRFRDRNRFGDGDRFESFILSMIFGRYTTRYHELGVRFDVTKFDITTSDGTDGVGSLLGFSSLHLPVKGAAVPFATIAAGGAIGSTGRFQMSFGGGYKAFMTDTAAMRVEYRYDVRFLEAANVDAHRILFGISAFHGPSSE
jgi:hypothetical protein